MFKQLFCTPGNKTGQIYRLKNDGNYKINTIHSKNTITKSYCAKGCEKVSCSACRKIDRKFKSLYIFF